MANNDPIQRFQNLLKELFQFEASDLDFGIYRILNFKRDQIAKFIDEELKEKVESAFAKHKDERLSNINQQFEEAKQKVTQALGQSAFTPTGELKEEFKETPVGKDFTTIKAHKEEVEAIEDIKIQVFNDLYNFFSRYYEEGDFIPQYRYSIKNYKYAIPYNGEEVKLYWANNEQYYTKTGMLFRDYTFKCDSYKVAFRTVAAEEELGSNKATKERFFILDDENPIEKLDDKVLIIRFQYRELTEEEIKSYGVEGGSNTSKQEKINLKTNDKILRKIDNATLKGLLSKEYKAEKSLLLYQISRFTAKNTKDYFIHKNLKKFLSEQLDYFIKAEVISIDTLEKEKFLDKHITRAKVVREIGGDIIDFLAQIEDFQKKLWEKKKFVLKTEYVITTDRVPEEFYQEIWKNKEQKKEWEALGFELPKLKEDLKAKKLPFDTKYFDEDFTERLLESLTAKDDLDDLLDGVLVKSENYQSLNLILEKYKEKLQTIYIDPPFNKEQDADYLYNVKYKDSTWISILQNRLQLAQDLLNDKGSIFIRCDYNGNMYVRLLMNKIFGVFCNEIVVGKTPGKKKTGLSLSYTKDYIVFYGKTISNTIKELWKNTETFLVYSEILKFLKNQKDIPSDKVDSIIREKLFWVNLDHRPGERKEKRNRVLLGIEFEPPKGRHWIKSQEKLNELYRNGKARIKCQNCEKVFYNEREIKQNCCSNKRLMIQIFLDEDSIGDNWTDISGYSQTWDFQTENSEILLKRVIESTSNKGELVMDFFLGSGTTTAVAHKLKRKWIGVEMGGHFYTVVLPRMKKVLAYDKSGISKEKDVEEKYNKNNAGGFFKYQIVEQYEDTLDNIELTPKEQAKLAFGDDYLLKYFLDFETRENATLLNIEKLKKPFAYKLKVNLEEVGEPQEITVDIPETFNYLLGLKVKKIKEREIASPAARNDNKIKSLNGKRKYLFILGEKEGKDIAIVWRDYEDNWEEKDFKNDKEFIIKELEAWAPNIVYINGQSILTQKLGKLDVEIHYIEPEFKNLMLG